MTAPLLVVGGTFDPPHRAHLAIARTAAAACGAAEILFVPAALSPHKTHDPPTPAPHRLAMLRLAVADLPGARISTIELDRPPPSWFAETIEAIHAAHPDRPLRFVLGGDQALGFRSWRAPEKILTHATPVVIPRPPLDRRGLIEAIRAAHGDAEAARWDPWILDVPPMPDASSAIRAAYRDGRPGDAEPFLAPPVAQYVRAHRLYGA